MFAPALPARNLLRPCCVSRAAAAAGGDCACCCGCRGLYRPQSNAPRPRRMPPKDAVGPLVAQTTSSCRWRCSSASSGCSTCATQQTTPSRTAWGVGHVAATTQHATEYGSERSRPECPCTARVRSTLSTARVLHPRCGLAGGRSPSAHPSGAEPCHRCAVATCRSHARGMPARRTALRCAAPLCAQVLLVAAVLRAALFGRRALPAAVAADGT